MLPMAVIGRKCLSDHKDDFSPPYNNDFVLRKRKYVVQ